MLRSKYVIPVIVIGGWLLFGTRVGQRGIWSSHEGRAAQNAWSILDSGNWLIPTLFTDTPDLQKPPLYYCMVAAMAKLGGGNVTGLAVRLPATLAAILGLILVYRLGQRMWGWETGLGAAIILATTTRYAWLARVGRIDMPLTVCCLAALYGFWKIVSQSPESRAKSQKPKAKSLNPKAKSLNPIWSIYLPLALGILLKGPVAAILVLLPVCTFLWITGQPWIPRLQPGWQETWRRFRVFEGLVAVAVLTIPWYAYVVWTTGGIFLWEFGVYHNLERALGTNEALKSGPVWFYFPRLFVDCFPWSLLLPAVCLTLWRLKAGGWRLETGDRRAESGERRAESGKQEFRNFRLSALSSPHSAFQPPASSLQPPVSSIRSCCRGSLVSSCSSVW